MRQIHDGYKGLVQMTNGHPQWTGVVRAMTGETLEAPLHWRKPQRIFVNSMSDLFHEALPDEVIDQIFTVMVAAPQHTYQILTKRPQRMLQYFQSGRHDCGNGPDRANYHLDENIWLGVSVEDQATADERIPLLLQTPAAVRFVSYEPALEPVDFSDWIGTDFLGGTNNGKGVDWIIVGGESGPGARPFQIEWAESAIKQCQAAGVKVFMKQVGKNPRIACIEYALENDRMKGADPLDWPRNIRVQEFPC
jgi:protein gp37